MLIISSKIANLPQIKEASERLAKAIKRQKPICILADADVDGVLSSSILAQTLSFISHPVKLIRFIPHADYRIEKAYINDLQNNWLVIALDIGTDEVELFSTFKNDFVILDHHQSKKSFNPIPENITLVNPHLTFEDFPQISTTILTIPFMAELLNTFLPQKDEQEKWILLHLPLVFLGAIQDHANFLFSDNNIPYLLNPQFPSLKYLFGKTGIKNNHPKNNVIRDIQFRVLPYLSAPCKFNRASLVFKFLSSIKTQDLQRHFEELAYYRHYKQSLEKFIFENFIRTLNPKKQEKFIVAKIDQDSEHLVGIIGSISNKLKDYFQKPTIVFCFYKGKLRGSARINDDQSLNLHEIFSHLLSTVPTLEFGGHKNALGLKIDPQDFDRFKDEINNF